METNSTPRTVSSFTRHEAGEQAGMRIGVALQAVNGLRDAAQGLVRSSQLMGRKHDAEGYTALAVTLEHVMQTLAEALALLKDRQSPDEKEN